MSGRCGFCGYAESDTANKRRFPFWSHKILSCAQKFCNACVDRELGRKLQFVCPGCGDAVIKAALTNREMDEVEVGEDRTHRKRVMRIFNKTEEEFETLEEYNDYLEMVEDIIYELTFSKDKSAANRKIAEYEAAHKQEILINEAKRRDRLAQEQDQIEQYNRRLQELKKQWDETDEQAELRKREQRLLDAKIRLGEEVYEEPIVEMHGAVAEPVPDSGRVDIDQLALLLNAQPPLPDPTLPPPAIADNPLQRWRAGGADKSYKHARDWLTLVSCLFDPVPEALLPPEPAIPPRIFTREQTQPAQLKS